MRATTLFLMAVFLLVTANLAWACWSGNDGYYIEANKYCDKTCTSSNQCGWPCPYCVWNGYQKRKRCKKIIMTSLHVWKTFSQYILIKEYF
uniref:Putative 5.3 kDa protein n=1 Tax=Ixodes ricinus TaxID=34613 RepID=A0A0K8RE40_IXORI